MDQTKQSHYILTGQLVFDILYRLVRVIVQSSPYRNKFYPYEWRHLSDNLSIDDIYLTAKCALSMIRHIIFDTNLPKYYQDCRFLAASAVFVSFGQYSELQITEGKFSQRVLGITYTFPFSEDWKNFIDLLSQYCSISKSIDDIGQDEYKDILLKLIELAKPFGDDDAVNDVFLIHKLLDEAKAQSEELQKYRQFEKLKTTKSKSESEMSFSTP